MQHKIQNINLIHPPEAEIVHLEPESETVMLGLSRYLNGHRIKLQGHIGYEWLTQAPLDPNKDYWYMLMQVEFWHLTALGYRNYIFYLCRDFERKGTIVPFFI